MTPAAVAFASELILTRRDKAGPVTIFLTRTPGTHTPWPTDRVPAGRTVYSIVGRYTSEITLAELRDDLAIAEREMRGAAAA